MSHQVQWSVTFPGAGARDRMQSAMAALRRQPPAELAGSPVTRTVDLATGEERDAAGRVRPVELLRSDVLMLYAEDGTRLVGRPSGTEPKVKFYLELVARVASTGEVAPTRTALDARGAEVKADILRRLGV